MAKLSKRFQGLRSSIDPNVHYSIDEAIELVK